MIDLMPTFLDAAQGSYPNSIEGTPSIPLAGESLLPAFRGGTVAREAIYWEHEGNRAVRMGDWKLVALGTTGKWELYNIAEDRTEQNNVAARHPERVRAMAAAWERWARENYAVPWPYQPQWGEQQQSGEA